MLRKIVLMVVIGLLVTGGVVFAMTKTEKGNGHQESAITQGRVTQIKGNIITITDNTGVERQVELNSAAGIRIGAETWCEEDCGKGLRIGDRNIRVKKVLGAAPPR